MRKKLIAALVVVVVLGGLSAYEWRYSNDMQAHITRVNSDLESARSQAQFSSGLFGSLGAMTAEADVAGEIIDTHYYVHTLKDEVLAWKIKQAAEDSTTLGEAMPAVIAKWQGCV